MVVLLLPVVHLLVGLLLVHLRVLQPVRHQDLLPLVLLPALLLVEVKASAMAMDKHTVQAAFFLLVLLTNLVSNVSMMVLLTASVILTTTMELQ